MGVYSGLESEIVPTEDSRERARLQETLGDSIQRHLDHVKQQEPKSPEQIAGLSPQQVLNIYHRILLLTQSLEEALKGGVMWPEDPQGPHGFTLWQARLGRRLGSGLCNELGLKMCQDAGFTVAKGQEILAALQPSFDKASE